MDQEEKDKIKVRTLRWMEKMSLSDQAIFWEETVSVLLDVVWLEDIECDQMYVTKLPDVIRQLGKGERVREKCAKAPYWQYHMHTIVEGTFPLENLPEHVRDIAKELYYN